MLFLDAYLGLPTSGNVSTWFDQSSQTNDVTQGTGSKQPAVSSDRGFPSVLFDGSDDQLIKSSGVTGHSLGQQITIFIVARFLSVNSGGSGDNLCRLYKSGGGNLAGNYAFNVPSKFWSLAADPFKQYGYLFSDTADPHIFEFRAGPSTSEVWLDGVSQVTGSDTLSLPAASKITIGEDDPRSTDAIDGHIHSVLVFADLPEADQETIRNRLTNRWGTS